MAALHGLLLAAMTLAPSDAMLFPATDPRIRIVGRTVRDGTDLLFDWSSTYIEVTATGPTSVRLREHFAHGNEYSVTINGTLGPSFQLNTSQATDEYAILKAGEGGRGRAWKG